MIKVNLPNKEYSVSVKILCNNQTIINAHSLSYEYEKGPIMYFPPLKTFDVKGQIIVTHMDRNTMYDLGLLELPKLKNLSLEAVSHKSRPNHSNEFAICKISTITIDIHADDVVRGPLDFTSNVEPRWYPLKVIK